jgi:autophagy-related protein 2
MASWFSSWIPTLPSISLPASIQARFISFVLKKSLGHLLKPGQLDVNQIDSQIGSGYVQVANLALDTQVGRPQSPETTALLKSFTVGNQFAPI